MDHILLCSDHLRCPPIEVEYLCDGTNFMYDFRDFHDYPARAGVDTMLLGNDQLPSMALKDSAPFVQAWLWFGLLSEALIFHPTTELEVFPQLFLKTKGTQKYLCTIRLSEMIRETKASKALYSLDMERLYSCIQNALDFGQKILSSDWAKSQIETTGIHHQVFKSILASQILCRTLLGAFCSSYSSRVQFPEAALKIVDFLLQQAGWCPEGVRGLTPDVCLRYHLSRYIRCPIRGDPKHTGGNGCVYASITHNVVTPRHVDPACDCKTIATTGDLRRFVSKGKVVLVRFCPNNENSNILEVKGVDITSKDMVPFIAVSHVRMAGLGNETANSLPSCQIRLIQSLADKLSKSNTESIFFWIDTLCVPRNRHLRKSALRLDWQLFAKAQHTLILDPPLYQYKFCTPEEALIRIRFSTWKMKLWTVKEGFLARELIFRFDDRLISLRELLADFDEYSVKAGKGLAVLSKPEHPLQQDIDEKGSELIKLFEQDINSWLGEEKSIPDATAGLLKMELYRALRIAYLSARKFQYLVESGELQQIPIVWEALKIYEATLIQEAEVRTNEEAGSRLKRFLEIYTSSSMESIAHLLDTNLPQKPQASSH
ncbi:hypothetical protein F5B19DRAFT_463088 [Rostrohypoxylon terebratum]|nr:hypothetical protein F5B19DRAFT_463088 [Rostrohypoxylon terebratum]